MAGGSLGWEARGGRLVPGSHAALLRVPLSAGRSRPRVPHSWELRAPGIVAGQRRAGAGALAAPLLHDLELAHWRVVGRGRAAHRPDLAARRPLLPDLCSHSAGLHAVGWL